MKDKIIETLNRIEKEHDIKIIRAVESGSRMWGFSSEDSDYDVRFIYMRKLPWYLRVSSAPDYLETLYPEENFDCVGWDIKKALSLLLKSNMSLFEWLSSPIVYKTSAEEEKFRAFALNFFDLKKLIFSYIHLASGNYKNYIEGKKQVKFKKYLYILRTIGACLWIEKYNTLPPITIDKLSPVIKDDNPFINTFLAELIEKKKASKELALGAPLPEVNAWIEEKLEYFNQKAAKMENRKIDISLVDKFFCEIILGE